MLTSSRAISGWRTLVSAESQVATLSQASVEATRDSSKIHTFPSAFALAIALAIVPLFSGDVV